MNKILLPSILAITILVAGIFAFQPIYEASTVHTTLIAAMNVQVTAGVHDLNEDRDQDGATDPFTYVVSDVTPRDMRTVHVAVTLEVEGDTNEDCTADGGEAITLVNATADELQILVGSGGAFNNIFDTTAEVEAGLVAAAGAPVRNTTGAGNVMCVLHATINPTGVANDVVIKKPTDVGAIQGDETITVVITTFA